MALAAGARLGPYEILSALGAGGMGEVYRARDPKLNRDVAIKVLPESVAHDRERLARFSREAQVLAALNHPNIAHIHGFEDSTGVPALVMELVEGPTLADRIATGSIPIDEALPIARQIADALEAAHAQGIIHRDLKPANIKVRDDGTVKVLDFGLAKALETSTASSPKVTQSPTITTPAMMTGVGVMLGTAAYMSPEQAKGRAADKQSDVWAFGCVLFEMLTGVRAFSAGDVAETIAAILTSMPHWTRLPSATPESCRRLLRRCLERDAKKRLGDIGAARLEIEDALNELRDGSAPAGASRSSRRLGLAVSTLAAGLLVGALGFAAWSAFVRKAGHDEAIRFLLPAPKGTTFANPGSTVGVLPALSPDGRTVAFGVIQDNRQSLWLHDVHSGAEHAIAGTDGATGQVFWSPDGHHIGFIADGQLKTEEMSSGLIHRVCEVPAPGPGQVSGGTWNGNGVILFGGGPAGIQRVADHGGAPVAVTHPQPNSDETIHRFPAFLPDGRHFLFLIQPNNTLAVGALDSPDITRLFETDSFGQYADPGYLIFVRQGGLMAQRFDAHRLAPSGQSVLIANGIASGFQTGYGAFSAAGATLFYRLGPNATRMSQLRWFDRAGTATSTLGPQLDYLALETGTDDRRIATHVHEAIGGGDIWIRDAERDTNTRLTEVGHNTGPVWSPDGSRIAFGSNRPATGNGPRDPYAGIFNLYEKRADADPSSPPTLLLDSTAAHLPNGWKQPTSWSADMLVFEALNPKTGFDIWMLPLAGDRTPRPILQTEANEFEGQISPDGRWLAYTSTETRRQEVYVRLLADMKGKIQVSRDGGNYPRWGRDGRELFYLEPGSARLMAVPVATTPTFSAEASRALFAVQLASSFRTGNLNANATVPYPYVVTKDGTRFLFSVDVFQQTPETPYTVTLNWQTGVRE